MKEESMDLDFKDKLFITIISWIALSGIGALLYYKPELAMSLYGGLFLLIAFSIRRGVFTDKKIEEEKENTAIEEENIYKYKYKNKLN